MLKQIAAPLKVRRGQTAYFKVSAGKNPNAYCPIYFQERGVSAPSPHIPASKMEVRGKFPLMLSPSFISTSALAPVRTLTLQADEDGTFYLFQDIDLKDDPVAKGRIWKDGPFTRLLAYARRWFHRNP